MRKGNLIFLCSLCIFLHLASVSYAQFQFNVNEKIEAEDLEVTDIAGNSWMRVGHGEGWLEHPSNFIYAMCGNRHWLCDDRTILRCQFACADVYVSMPITIPEEGDYVIYAYVASWSDSAVIEDNRGCDRGDKWECTGWFVTWDDVSLLDKVLGGGGDWNVSHDYYWATYPHNTYCGRFDLDALSVGYNRSEDCQFGDPRDCELPTTIFNLSAGEHTLYLKVADEYTLLDWLYVAKDGDPAPAAEPGRSWQATSVESRIVHRPEVFVLEQNYPNPFNAGTMINYSITRPAEVKLVVYNISGQEVSVLVNSTQSAGHYSILFDASGLPSGTYLYKLEATCNSCGGKKTLFSETKEMVLIK